MWRRLVVNDVAYPNDGNQPGSERHGTKQVHFQQQNW